MNDFNGYAVFFFPQALEALGEAIAPYLQESPGGPHVLCREIDTGGSLIELTMDGRTTDGQRIDLELMLPTNMVRMIVSARGDSSFGFGPRVAVAPAQAAPPVIEAGDGPALAPTSSKSARARKTTNPAGQAGKAGKGKDKPAPAGKAAAAKTAKPGARQSAPKTGKSAAGKAGKSGKSAADKAGKSGKSAAGKPAKKQARRK